MRLVRPVLPVWLSGPYVSALINFERADEVDDSRHIHPKRGELIRAGDVDPCAGCVRAAEMPPAAAGIEELGARKLPASSLSGSMLSSASTPPLGLSRAREKRWGSGKTKQSIRRRRALTAAQRGRIR
jgi:hypothetical protein